LRGCEVVALDALSAHRVGSLLARARSKDIVDGMVVHVALQRSADIATGDRLDIERLVRAAGGRGVLIFDV
jgi:hypothetical protein